VGVSKKNGATSGQKEKKGKAKMAKEKEKS